MFPFDPHENIRKTKGNIGKEGVKIKRKKIVIAYDYEMKFLPVNQYTKLLAHMCNSLYRSSSPEIGKAIFLKSLFGMGVLL